jgi:MoaA/NifB/PqqE/SkfB family radical SAM enzyme
MKTKMSDIIMGYACNNNCMHCTRGNADRKLNLSYKDVVRLIDEIKERGATKVVLQGGEPTIREDFLDIIRYVKKSGFREVQIQSNGRMFAYLSYAREVSRNNITEFCISVHARSADKHDAFTGVKGSYAQTMEGIRNLVGLGQFVRALIILTKQNYTDLRKIVDNMLNLGVKSFQIGMVIPEGNAYNNFSEVVPKLSETEPCLMETLGFLKRKNMAFNTQDIPRCFLKGFEEFVLEVPGVDAEKIFPEKRFPDSEKARQNRKVLSRGCRQCRHFEICEGVYKEYAKRFGLDELKPVR